MDEVGWFSDIDEDATGENKWQPSLETGAFHVPSLPVWFATKDECDDWIKKYILDKGMIA